MAPLDLNTLLGPLGTSLLYIVTGIWFGFVLEQAGFGNSRNLAAQFYLTDMRVLKVMFTGIITAMLLVFWSGALGFLDLKAVYLNPTHLWPGIVGGVIFGVGFVIGGYCPGTALVSTATLKLDGLVFVLGIGAGMFAFGELIGPFRAFYDRSGFYGDLTLMDVFGLSPGVVVLFVVLMALGMFYGAEKVEAWFAARAGRNAAG